MKILKTILLCFTIVLFASCSKDDDSSPVANNPPGEFTASSSLVAVVSLQNSIVNSLPSEYAYRMIWTEAIDPDGDTVTYDIYVDNTLMLENQTILTTDILRADVLDVIGNAAETFVLKIVAKDVYGATSEALNTYTEET
jgi:PBP1b-binding outer membrane lipoprotein LpoB